MYEIQITVRYSETDQEGFVSPNQILNYFQDTAISHSMALGLNIGGDFEPGHGWYILSWDVNIYRYPSIGEKLYVSTDPYKMKGFYGYRRFFIRDENHDLVAQADSIWLLMDIESRQPVRISKELMALFVAPDSDGKVTIRRKLPQDGAWSLQNTFKITELFLDSNHHVNNTYYVQWAQMMLPHDSKIKKLKVDYRQSTWKGDVLRVYSCVEDDKYRVRYVNQEDVLIALVDMTF